MKGKLQVYRGDPRTFTIFIPAWGSNWGSSGFSRNQNNLGSSGVYEHGDKHTQSALQHANTAKILDVFVSHLFIACSLCLAKTQRPQIWALWLLTPLHRVVLEVWDLPCISVGDTQLIFTECLNLLKMAWIWARMMQTTSYKTTYTSK